MNSKKVQTISGVELSKSLVFSDFRGSFIKIHPLEKLNGILDTVAASYNPIMGTIRGLHLQIEPFAEEKIVTCVQGSIFDVAVDLRIESATFGKWMGVKLDSRTGDQIYLPKGVAHGFQTLAPDSLILYSISASYAEDAALVINPLGDLEIDWPIPHSLISERDLSGVTFKIASSIYSESVIKPFT